MKYLLDTDTCVFWLRGRELVRERVRAVDAAAIAVSAITLAELRYGASCSAQREANHQAIDDFISGIIVLDMGSAVAAVFGDLKAQLRQQGMLIEDFDLAIAATALVYDLVVVTNNEKHFSRIAELRLENWVEKLT
jgi:tRNA(fMet)-specific endonuclease VapC